jgi:hypothetical protein
MKDPKPCEPHPANRPVTKRLPYERPQVVSEEVFETQALACANQQFVCAGDRS